MRLHDLQVGQRFSFTGKHRGKVFEVSERRSKGSITFKDVATNQERSTNETRKTFRMDVELEERTVTITDQESRELSQIVHERYLMMCVTGYSEEAKSIVNELYCKLTGLPVRRRILPKGE